MVATSIHSLIVPTNSPAAVFHTTRVSRKSNITIGWNARNQPRSVLYCVNHWCTQRAKRLLFQGHLESTTQPNRVWKSEANGQSRETYSSATASKSSLCECHCGGGRSHVDSAVVIGEQRLHEFFVIDSSRGIGIEELEKLLRLWWSDADIHFADHILSSFFCIKDTASPEKEQKVKYIYIYTQRTKTSLDSRTGTSRYWT